jgi:hypothetical protein
MIVHFRKRLLEEDLNTINDMIAVRGKAQLLEALSSQGSWEFRPSRELRRRHRRCCVREMPLTAFGIPARTPGFRFQSAWLVPSLLRSPFFGVPISIVLKQSIVGNSRCRFIL